MGLLVIVEMQWHMLRTHLQSHGCCFSLRCSRARHGICRTVECDPTVEVAVRTPLISPHSQYMGYLGRIFLKNDLPFTQTWASQIISAVAWLNVALLFGNGRGKP